MELAGIWLALAGVLDIVLDLTYCRIIGVSYWIVIDLDYCIVLAIGIIDWIVNYWIGNGIGNFGLASGWLAGLADWLVFGIGIGFGNLDLYLAGLVLALDCFGSVICIDCIDCIWIVLDLVLTDRICI